MKNILICMILVLLFTSRVSAMGLEKIKEETTNAKTESQKKSKKIKINESEYEPVLIGALLEKPKEYIGKKIKFRGKFSSFTTLALDYGRALRKSKDYISICIFRTDSKIPLSELKLAYPVKEAKEDQVIRELEEGDLLEIFGTVFSDALDEPWVDITSLKMLQKINPNKKTEEKISQEKSSKNKDTKTRRKETTPQKD